MRVGLGFDSHRFATGRPLILGGVEIAGHAGLEGHSDGDAVCHAITDAILGAAGLGSIGEHFPSTDPDLEGADSLELLARTVQRIEEENYQVVNVDLTVVTESPRISPHAEPMRENLGERLHVPATHVSIRGKTGEGMGWVGKGEGLAVMAVALVNRIEDLDALHATIRSGG